MTPRTKTPPAVVVDDALATPTLPLDALIPNPGNPRRDLGDLTDLIASIEAVGILQPLTVAPFSPGRYVVIDGHRRYAAAQAATLTTVPVNIRADITGDAQVLTAALITALHRTDLTPMEEATAYEQLGLIGMDAKAIAKATGRPRKTVEARIALMALPEKVRDGVHAAQISLDEAAAMAEFDDDPAAIKVLMAAAGGRDFAFEVSRQRDARERRAKVAAATEALTVRGFRLLTQKEITDQQWWGYRLSVEDDQADPQAHVAHVTLGGHISFYDKQAKAAADETKRDAAYEATAGRRPTQDTTDVTTPGDGQSTAEDLAELQAQDAAKAAEQDACDAAAAVRRDFILSLTTPHRAMLADHSNAIAGYLVHTLQTASLDRDPEPEHWMRWLVADQLADREWDDWAALLAATVEGRDQHRVLLAALASLEEPGLDQAWRWEAPHLAGDRATWLRLLEALGYEASSWELEHLAAADAFTAQVAKTQAEAAAEADTAEQS